MIISGEGGMVSHGHLAQFLTILEIKIRTFFLSALEFIIRHPEVEFVPPKYLPNSCVLL